MSCADRPLLRSFLYAPGSSPELMRKAAKSGADAVVLDLEDAVAAADDEMATAAVASMLDERAAGVTPGQGEPELHVRVEREGQAYADRHLASVVRPGLDAVRLPKVEGPDAVAQVGLRLDELEVQRSMQPGSVGLYLTVESARGVLEIQRALTASSRVIGAAFGATDLLADLGAHGDDDLATLHSRSHLVLACRAAGVAPPIDSVHTNLGDGGELRLAAQRARALGFFGKSVIHPRQLAVVHEVFTPTDEQIAHAERLLSSLSNPARSTRATAVVDGEFVDPAVIARARAILRLRRNR